MNGRIYHYSNFCESASSTGADTVYTGPWSPAGPTDTPCTQAGKFKVKNMFTEKITRSVTQDLDGLKAV